MHVQISQVAHRTILMECQNKLPVQCTHSADQSYNYEWMYFIVGEGLVIKKNVWHAKILDFRFV